MKIFCKFILFTILLGFNNSHSQITTTIDEVYVNGQTSVTNCGTIDFETTENNTLTFYYTLTKASSSSGEGYLKIKLKYDSSSSGGEKGTQYITSNLWTNNEYTHTIATNIDASEVQVSGSSIYLEFTKVSSPFTYYNSCEYPLIKTLVPKFNISPTSVSIGCGSTSQETFTVVNVHNFPGALSYSWNVGTGWKRNGVAVSGIIATTTNSITLEPVSPISLPSSISVTTTLDGTSYPTKTATVSRSSFNPNYSISGASKLCSSATYSINNLPSNLSVIWSSSSTNIATITPINNTQATLTKEGVGTVTISALVKNACGQQKTFTKNVTVGSAGVDFIMFSNGVGETDYFCSSHGNNTYEIISETPVMYHQIRLKKYPNLNVVYSPSTTYAGNIGTIESIRSGSGSYLLEVKITDSCGTTDWDGYEVDFIDCSGEGGGGEMEYRIYPNPTSETLSIKKKQLTEEKIISKSKKNTNASYKLYDYNANLVGKGYVNDETTIDISNYKKGKYFLKIESSKKSKTYQIIVE